MPNKSNKLVSVNILTYNAQDLIEPCLKSVLAQTYKNIEILVIDNSSIDKTKKVIENWKSKIGNFRFIENSINLGYTGGHNMGIRKCRGEYILCLNQDVVLDKDFVKNVVEAMEVDEKIGAVQGKLYKITRDMCEAKLHTSNMGEIRSPVGDRSSNIIDSVGLLMFKNRRVVSQGQGEKDKGQYQRGEIFGVDGAAPLYRRSALEDIKLPIFKGRTPKSDEFEYFDEDFFMYKEDIDLAWRLRLYGWKAVYEPKAVGYHLRGAGEGAVKNYLKVAKARRKISDFAKYYSFKNQRLMQIKNELPSLFFRDFYRIITKEIAAWLYVLLFEKYALKAITELVKQAPKAWRKRKIIMRRKKVKYRQMRKWFV